MQFTSREDESTFILSCSLQIVLLIYSSYCFPVAIKFIYYPFLFRVQISIEVAQKGRNETPLRTLRHFWIGSRILIKTMFKCTTVGPRLTATSLMDHLIITTTLCAPNELTFQTFPFFTIPR